MLVVGAGCSGLPAAVTAAEGGAKVMLVDRMEQGFGIRCSALGAIDSSIQQELGVTIDKMDILNDIARYADGQCDMRIWKTSTAVPRSSTNSSWRTARSWAPTSPPARTLTT